MTDYSGDEKDTRDNTLPPVCKRRKHICLSQKIIEAGRKDMSAGTEGKERHEFGAVLRSKIYAAGYVRLVDFAKAVEKKLGSQFDRQVLSAYLSGRNWPQLVRLIKMCEVLNCEVEDLLPPARWGYIEGLRGVRDLPDPVEPFDAIPEGTFDLKAGKNATRVVMKMTVPKHVAFKIAAIIAEFAE